MMRWHFSFEHFRCSMPSRFWFRVYPSEKMTVEAYYYGFEIRNRRNIFYIWIAKQFR